MALSTGLILLMAKDGGASPFKKPLWAGFRWLGKNSYELYLFHILVLALMRVAVKRDALPFFAKPFWFLLFLALSSAAAELVARFFSEPLNLRLRGLARSQRLGGGG